MKKLKMIIALVSICVFVTGCATGGSHIEGNLRVDHVGQTSFLQKGATMSQFYEKDEKGAWIKIGEPVMVNNNSVAEQLAGSAASVGSAALIGNGMAKRGGKRGSGGGGGNTIINNRASTSMSGWHWITEKENWTPPDSNPPTSLNY